MVASVLQHAGDASLVAEESEAVGIGHTGTVSHAVLSQHLVGPGVAGLVVGNAVTDIPRNLLDFLSLAQPIEAGNEIFGVLGSGSVEFSVLAVSEGISS